jgi:hypothetical protein
MIVKSVISILPLKNECAFSHCFAALKHTLYGITLKCAG